MQYPVANLIGRAEVNGNHQAIAGMHTPAKAVSVEADQAAEIVQAIVEDVVALLTRFSECMRKLASSVTPVSKPPISSIIAFNERFRRWSEYLLDIAGDHLPSVNRELRTTLESQISRLREQLIHEIESITALFAHAPRHSPEDTVEKGGTLS